MPRAAPEIIQDLRQQNSAKKRKHAIPEFTKALRRDSFQATWEAVGAASGVASLMRELSIRDLRELCKRLGMTASARQARPQRRAALGELVIILFEGHNDGRPLNRFYQNIVPACELEIIERFRCPWTPSQQKFLLAGQREHNEIKFLDEISSKDVVLVQRQSLFRGNIPLTERILKTILTSKKCPPDLIDELVMRSLKRLLKSRYDDKTRNQYLDLVLQVAQRHEDEIARQLSLEKGGLVQFIVDRWCNAPPGSESKRELNSYLKQAIELLPSTSKSQANDFGRLQRAICDSTRLSHEERYGLFRLFLLHMKDYQVDIESNSEEDLTRLRQFTQWPSSLFFSMSYRMSLRLFEKLDKLFPQRDFLQVETQKGTILNQSQGRIKHSPCGDVEIVKALLVRRSKTQHEHPGWLQHAIDLIKERRTKAQQSREAAERAYFAISAVNLCAAAGHLPSLKETILWSQRFIKDSAVSHRLFSENVLSTREIGELLGAMPDGNIDSPEAVVAFTFSLSKTDLDLANQILIEMVVSVNMAAGEPGFQAHNWTWLLNLIRSMAIDRRASNLDILFNSLSKCTESDRERCQRDLLEIVWKPMIDTLIQIEAALEATHGSLHLDSIKGIYLYQRLANASLSPLTLAELTQFLIDQMRARLGSRGLRAQMHSVVSAIDCLASSEPQLACPFIRDLILDDDFKEASSWHRQLMSHKFLSVLPARKAEEFLRTMANAMTERMRDQNQNFDWKEAESVKDLDTSMDKKSRPIKVTTVKMLAQLLQHKVFIDPSLSCEILIGLLSEARHIDIRLATAESLLETMEQPDCPPSIRDRILSALEEYVVPVASQLNERRDVTESDWTAASEDDANLPAIGEDTPLLDLLIEKTRLSKLKDTDKLRLAQMVTTAIEQSAVLNTRYLNLFLTKNNFPLETLPKMPVHLAPLSKAFIHLTPYMSSSAYEMIRAATFLYVEPSTGMKAISKAVREDRELVNSNSGKHWLSQFASGNEHRFVLIHVPRLLQQSPDQLSSKLVSDGVNRTSLLQLVHGWVERMLKVDRTGDIVTIVRRLSSDRLKSREHWENWYKNCLPVIETVILQTKEAQPPALFLIKLHTLPLPLPDATEEEDRAFTEKLYEVIEGLARRQDYPYHTDLGTLKQEINYWPLAECFGRFALKLAAAQDLKEEEEPRLADYLCWEIVAHLLTKASGPKALGMRVKKLLQEWSEFDDKMIKAMGIDLERTIRHRDWLTTN
ncbi:unnamed protein product [Fusarium langsethiae]|nr:unnamed protein product [Fusarium langsethiae]